MLGAAGRRLHGARTGCQQVRVMLEQEDTIDFIQAGQDLFRCRTY